MSTPAQDLLGIELEDGWVVVEQFSRSYTPIGGSSTVGYFVEHKFSKRKGFLKALDLLEGMKGGDSARTLQIMTTAFNHERDLLLKCKGRRLDRVSLALSDGSHNFSSGSLPFDIQVPYIIFELAEGDIRSVNSGERFDLAYKLRCAHHATVGLSQLHSAGISHQDVKPSNLLAFPGSLVKLSDLGRAIDRYRSGPYDDLDIAGDLAYAPPELRYRHVATDWRKRRLGADMYQLGSLIGFIFAEVNMTTLLFTKLEPEAKPWFWKGTYLEAVPFLLEAYSKAIESLGSALTSTYPSRVASSINSSVSEMCFPDLEKRGHPINRTGNRDQFSLERYISLYNRLAEACENDLLEAIGI